LDLLWVKLSDGINTLQLHKLALANEISIANDPILSA